MNKVKIMVYPKNNTFNQRLTVIVSTILGLPYHLTLSQHNLWKLHDQLNNLEE